MVLGIISWATNISWERYFVVILFVALLEMINLLLFNCSRENLAFVLNISHRFGIIRPQIFMYLDASVGKGLFNCITRMDTILFDKTGFEGKTYHKIAVQVILFISLHRFGKCISIFRIICRYFIARM